MTRLLITGAGGFVGRHCLRPALAKGFDVWAVASPRSIAALRDIDPRINWRSADLLQAGALEALISEIKPAYLLHLAWVTAHGSYWTSADNLDWLALGARMFRSFAEHGGKRLVAAGTCAEYDWNAGYMVEGSAREAPATFYGRIKLLHHQALMASARQFDFSAATGRIFFVYGPHEGPSRIVPYACAQLAKGLPAEFGTGNFYRDFMYVDDVAAGLVALLQSDIQGACNVSSGAPYRLADIVNLIGSLANRPDLIRLGARPDRPDDPPLLVGDNARLRATGWSPDLSLKEGLTRSLEWARANAAPDL